MPEIETLNGVRWSAPEEDRVYTPPTPPEQFESPRVTAHAINVDGSVIEKVHATQEHAKTSYEKFLNSIPREHYSPEGLKDQISKFADTAAAKAAFAGVAKVEALVGDAAAQVDKIRKQLSPDGDVAAELRAGRYWDRTRSLLDNAKEGAFAKAQQLIANADRTELGTLLQELPAYLQARGVTSDWIEAAVGRAVPEYALATERFHRAQQAQTVARSNAESLRRYFSNEGHRSVLVKYNPKLDPDKV
jgi:hypothetical protein